MSSAFEQLRTVLIATALILLPKQAQPATYLPNRRPKTTLYSPVCYVCRRPHHKVASRRAAHTTPNKNAAASDKKKKRRIVFALV